MATTIRTQPDELRRLLDDPDPAAAAAQRMAGRRTWLVGIGTSWHAAHHGAWLLRDAGLDAAALHAADVLSDDTIVDRLRGAGIDIARRTVAKYREAMRIPSSVQRRRDKQSMLGNALSAPAVPSDRSRDTAPA